MYFSDNIENINNPIYELLIYLNEYDEERLYDDKFAMLLKNLRTSFIKLLYSVNYLNKMQSNKEFVSENEIFKTQIIEYCYLKVSTTWDISYQIANELIKFKKIKSKNKYESLEIEFEEYCDHLNNLQVSWYRKINSLRNKVAHGGVNIIPYYEDERLLFQAYDNDVEEMIEYSNYYCKSEKNLVFADYYFNYYTCVLHSYLVDFFKFIMTKLIGDKKLTIKLTDNPMGMFEKSHKHWGIDNLKLFNNITQNMQDSEKYNKQFPSFRQ